MTKQTLETLKPITTWGGVMVTLSGVAINIVRDGASNIPGHAISIFGIAVTVCGHCIANALSKQQKSENTAAEARIVALTERLDSAEEILGNSSLKQLIDDETARWADEHQDDGR